MPLRPLLKIASGYRDRLITSLVPRLSSLGMRLADNCVHYNNLPVSDTCLNQGGNIWFRAAENKADDNDTIQSHNTNNNNKNNNNKNNNK